MNYQITQRITPSLTALRGRFNPDDEILARVNAKHWLANPEKPVPEHLQLAAALLRRQDVTRTFSLIVNSRKLENGQLPYAGLVRAAQSLVHALKRKDSEFEGLPLVIREYLEKGAILAGVAALQAGFNTAIAQNKAAWAKSRMYAAMRLCPQGSKQTTLDHCYSVARYYRVLFMKLTQPGWSEKHYVQLNQYLPKWFDTWRAQLAQAISGRSGIAQIYLQWHDCGKPFCLEYDDQGRAHFPDHAQVSAQLWRAVGGLEEVARLIEQDMALHTLPPSAMPEFAKQPDAALLLVAALAAVIANAEMFGGFESDSFKIKLKQLDARGKRLCGVLFGESNIKAVL